MKMTWEIYSEIEAWLQERAGHRIYVKDLLIGSRDCETAIAIIDSETAADKKIWTALEHWGSLHRPKITGSMARKNPHITPPLSDEEKELIMDAYDAIHPSFG